jgi:NAD(P)-dependent dehydrogenase (short-subunit alcohol dehydrogenase family)
MSPLGNQVLAIVGASSGIGLATARAAALQGAQVVMISQNREKLEEAARTVEGVARPVPMDMLDRTAVERTFGELGVLDHLILTAVPNEYAFFGPFADLREDQLERSLDKVRGFVNVTRTAARRLREGGSITLLSGAGALRPPSGTALAAAMNSAVVGLGKALAVELAPTRVNVVMPGVVDTPLHGDRREGLRTWAESGSLPARHFGQPADIAEAILFLLQNPYVSGHTLVIDGGFLLV